MTRVFIVARDSVSRSRLRDLLAGHDDIDVVGDGDISSSAIESDVILWYLGRDTFDGRPHVPVLTADDIPIVMLGPGSELAGALGAGVRGFLTTDPEAGQLVAALHAVAGGLQVIDPDAAAEGVDSDEEPGRSEGLTDREHEVLQLLAEGLPNKEIARRLQISEHTVKFHLNAIMGKLGAHTRTEAVTRAARRGLITL